MFVDTIGVDDTTESRMGSSRSFTAMARRRPSAAKRGYDATWRKLSATHLREHPFCVRCLEGGVFEQATDVDHIRAHCGDDSLRLDPGNLQSLCHSHHSQKTVAQDGGFGRKPKGAA